MICPNCKKEIADDSINCPQCGQKLSKKRQDSQKPPSQRKLDASGHPKPKKRSIKPLPIIFGVFLAAAVTVFFGWTFARADLIRFFLGNTRYAAAFAKGTVNAIADSGYLESALIYEWSHYLSTAQEQYKKYEQYVRDHPDNKLSYQNYEKLLLRSDILSAFHQFLPEKGIYIKAEIETDPLEKLYKLAAETLHTDIEKIEKAFAALNHTTIKGNLSIKDNTADLSYLISQKEQQLDSGDLYYNTKESSLYYLNPDLYGSALRTEIQALNTDSENNGYNIDKSKTEKERKAIINELADIYLKHLRNARTYYSDTTETAGKGEFKGKSMSVTFENEVIIELFRDMANAFYDSDYFNTLLKAAFDGAVPERISALELKKAASESLDELMNSADDLSITVEFYINTDNSFAGLSIRSNSVKGNESYSTQIKFINTKTDIYAEVTAGDNTYIKVECEKSSDSSGTLNIGINLPENSIRDEAQNLDIAIIYSDLGHKKVFDKNLLLGIFNIDVSGSLLDELSLRSDAIDYGTLTRKSDFTLSAKDSEKGIEYGIQVKNESYGNVTVTAEIGENQEPIFDRIGMTLEEAVDLRQNNPRTLEAKIGALKHIRELCGENGLLKVCFEYILEKNNIENIDEEIEKLENQLKDNE
ncbi:MAG: zinc ribbon domain-containing protein [Ruminiclostridium sp.]|nr:zinc ribbon domain-containing protein [Ruminiclostridium sp.]